MKLRTCTRCGLGVPHTAGCLPSGDLVWVCRNGEATHPRRQRTSAKARKTLDLIAKLAR